MTDLEIKRLLENVSEVCNDAIDKLIPERQASIPGRKQKLSYVVKKLEIIVGACHKAQDKLDFIEFKLDFE